MLPTRAEMLARRSSRCASRRSKCFATSSAEGVDREARRQGIRTHVCEALLGREALCRIVQTRRRRSRRGAGGPVPAATSRAGGLDPCLVGDVECHDPQPGLLRSQCNQVRFERRPATRCEHLQRTAARQAAGGRIRGRCRGWRRSPAHGCRRERKSAYCGASRSGSGGEMHVQGSQRLRTGSARGDATARGHRVFVRTAVVEGRPPLLLIHGYPTASYDWVRVWPRLAARYSLYALDLLGFGSSEKPRDCDHPIALQADLCMALLDDWRRAGRPRAGARLWRHGRAGTPRARAGRPAASREHGVPERRAVPGEHRARPIQKLLANPLLGRCSRTPWGTRSSRRPCCRLRGASRRPVRSCRPLGADRE